MKACVSGGEPEEALPLPVTYTALGRSCAHETEDTGMGELPLLNRDFTRSLRYHSYQGHFLL